MGFPETYNGSLALSMPQNQLPFPRKWFILEINTKYLIWLNIIWISDLILVKKM